MNEYIIVTDSTCDLTPDMIEQLQIEVLPMTFHLDGKDYKNFSDNREMSTSDFYNALRNGSSSTTSQITPMDFEDAFTPILQKGLDIFFMCFSSGLSGTFASAKIAAKSLQEKFTNNKVIVVDTLSASMGQGLLVYHAVTQRRKGLDIDALNTWVIENRLNMCLWFTVDDLNHLHRGGRISKAAAVFGSALNIKPVLHVDDEGHLIPMKKVRGRRNSLDAIVAMMEETAINPREQTIFVSHGDCLDDAKYVAQKVKETFKIKDIHINAIGPVIGTHSGPGTVALFFIGTHR